MNFTATQWVDILKAWGPPLITGIIGIAAVLIGQRLQKNHDDSKLQDEKHRESVEVRILHLQELIDSLDEVEALNMFCVGQGRNSQEADKAATVIMKNLNSDPESSKLAPTLLQSITERSHKREELFFKMHEGCMNATRAAQRIGKLPRDIKIEGEEGLIEAVRKWRWANVALAQRPNRKVEEVEALIKDLRVKIRNASTQYLERLDSAS